MLKFARKSDDEVRLDEKPDGHSYEDDASSKDNHSVVHKPLISVSLFGFGKHKISYFRAICKAFCCPFVKSIHYSVRTSIFIKSRNGGYIANLYNKSKHFIWQHI